MPVHFTILDLQHSEFPGDMVKRIPKISDNITNNQSPTLAEGRVNFNLDQFCSYEHALRYGLFADGMLWIERAPNTTLESINVYIRPVNLELGTIEWAHMLYYPCGEEKGKDVY